MNQIFIEKPVSERDILKIMAQQNAPKGMSSEQHPFLKGLEKRIRELEFLMVEIDLEREMLSRLRDHVLEALKGEKKPEPEAQIPNGKSDEKPQKMEEKSDTSDEKAPSEEPVAPRLEALEKGVKRAIKTLKKAPMLKTFKSLRLLNRTLAAAVGKSEPGQMQFERIAKLEMAIGEALNFLQTSKQAARSNVLKEMKKILEETLDKAAQI
jgi:hypothetical protein